MNIFQKDDEDLLETPIASSTECTGLIPALPESEDELEAYEDMYPFITPASSEDPHIS